MQALFDAVRQACSPHVWSRGVEFTRANAVLSERADDDEVVFKVVAQDKAVQPTVTLWPDDEDWSCDCDHPEDGMRARGGSGYRLPTRRPGGQALARGAAGQRQVALRVQPFRWGLELRALRRPRGPRATPGIAVIAEPDAARRLFVPGPGVHRGSGRAGGFGSRVGPGSVPSRPVASPDDAQASYRAGALC